VDDGAFDDNMTHGHEEGRNNAMQEDGRHPSYSLATPVISPVIPTVDLLDQETQGSVDKVCGCLALSKSELTARK
jgi:hypothetical protein